MKQSTRHNHIPVNHPFDSIYAHAVKSHSNASTLYISGQGGQSPNRTISTDFSEQCRQAILNIEAILQSADMQLKDLVQMNIYLTSRNYMDELVEIRKEMLWGIRPAITTIIVAGLVSSSWLLEIDAVACEYP